MKLISGKQEFSLILSPFPGNRGPKRVNLHLTVSVDGSETMQIPVTTNAAYAAGAAVNFYPYFMIDGKAYYAVLTEAELKKVGAEVTIDKGVAKRANPKPVTAKPEREAARIVKFKATLASRA